MADHRPLVTVNSRHQKLPVGDTLLGTDLPALSSTVAAVPAALSVLSSNLSAVSSALSTLRSDTAVGMNLLSGNLLAVASNLSTTVSGLAAVSVNVSAVSSALSALSATRASLSSVSGALSPTVTTLAAVSAAVGVGGNVSTVSSNLSNVSASLSAMAAIAPVPTFTWAAGAGSAAALSGVVVTAVSRTPYEVAYRVDFTWTLAASTQQVRLRMAGLPANKIADVAVSMVNPATLLSPDSIGALAVPASGAVDVYFRNNATGPLQGQLWVKVAV